MIQSSAGVEYPKPGIFDGLESVPVSVSICFSVASIKKIISEKRIFAKLFYSQNRFEL